MVSHAVVRRLLARLCLLVRETTRVPWQVQPQPRHQLDHKARMTPKTLLTELTVVSIRVHLRIASATRCTPYHGTL